MTLISLPVDSILSEVLGSLEKNQNLILKASAGSGKTTRVPPALLKSNLFSPQQEIWVLVPRRLAAKMAATRIAFEMGEVVGESVGYQFRFEKVIGKKTRLKLITEGMFLRLLMNQPTLPSVGLVILDEFHERHLHADVALSYLRFLQKTTRPDLKVLLMSATLETQAVSGFLGNTPVIELEAPCFPVEMKYFSFSSSVPLETRVYQAVSQALRDFKGDILVFLPGMAEILKCQSALEKTLPPSAQLLPLHGDLPKEEQNLIFEKTSHRKIILSTNIAESSLTLENVSTVIDSGLHRQASFSVWSGIPSLKTRPVSQASAIQRAGRAGRTAPGTCFRLYSESDFLGRPAFELPEILRSDLAQTLLELKMLGVKNLSTWEWYTPPSPSALQAAQNLLFHLGALDTPADESSLTTLGKEMAKIPLHPRLSRLVLKAQELKIIEEGCWLAALLSEDAVEDYYILNDIENRRANENVRRVYQNLLSYFSTHVSSSRSVSDLNEKVARCLLAGFPDRVACHRAGTQELVFCEGGSGRSTEKQIFKSEKWCVVLKVQETQSQANFRTKVLVRTICPISEESLLEISSMLREKNELIWENKSQRVMRQTGLYYGTLAIEENLQPAQAEPEAVSLFIQSAFGWRLDSLNLPLTPSVFFEALSHYLNPQPLQETLARLQWMKPEIFQDFSKTVRKLFDGLTSIKQLKELDLQNLPLALLSASEQHRIREELPTHIDLAGRKRVPVHYEFEKPPWIESRLQDFFGMKESLRLMNGKIPLTLHLLAPNRLPVQVTQDLAGFWQKTYPQLRPQLSRRYPKHKWPEV